MANWLSVIRSDWCAILFNIMQIILQGRSVGRFQCRSVGRVCVVSMNVARSVDISIYQ